MLSAVRQGAELLKRRFTLPNEMFALELNSAEISIYAYLLYLENRQTHQCWPSYKTIGKAVDLSPKTVKKYVGELVDKGLIATENTSIITRDGMKRNGSLRYTILPVQNVVAEKMKHDLDRLSQDTARYEAQKKLAAASLIPAENTEVF